MAGLGRKCWQVQNYLMGSQAGIIKNRANIVQLLRIHSFNTLLSFGSYYIFFFFIARPENKRTFPDGSDESTGKESTCNVRDLGLILGLG